MSFQTQLAQLETAVSNGQLTAEAAKNIRAWLVEPRYADYAPDVADSQQENSEIDRLIIGNIENIELDLPNDYFDVIICGDVLEHLVDPWNTMAKLHKHLKQNGVIIIINHFIIL